MARFSRFLPITSLLLPLLGCSDPIPPAAEGSWSLTFSSKSNEVGKSCGITTHNSNVGIITPTDLDDTALRKHTIDGSSVLCQVIQRGAAYGVEGTNTLGVRMLSIQIGDISGSASETEPAEGHVQYKSEETQNMFSSPTDSPCLFYFNTNKQQIAPGRVWVEFECDVVRLASQDLSCSILEGVVAFQNCEQ